MKSAGELLRAFTSAGPEEAADFFAEDAELDIPYLFDIGVESRYEGYDTISRFPQFMHRTLYPGFAFEGVEVHLETGDRAFGEYHIRARSAISGRYIHQHFFGYLVAERGKNKAAPRGPQRGRHRRSNV
jgi:hypothetical protein